MLYQTPTYAQQEGFPFFSAPTSSVSLVTDQVVAREGLYRKEGARGRQLHWNNDTPPPLHWKTFLWWISSLHLRYIWPNCTVCIFVRCSWDVGLKIDSVRGHYNSLINNHGFYAKIALEPSVPYNLHFALVSIVTGGYILTEIFCFMKEVVKIMKYLVYSIHCFVCLLITAWTNQVGDNAWCSYRICGYNNITAPEQSGGCWP